MILNIDNKSLRIIRTGFKIIFFGFYYFWLCKMLAFYFFQDTANSDNNACATGWLTVVIYPLATIMLSILYLVLIHLYSKATKENVSLLYKLILWPLSIIMVFLIFF